MTAPLSVLAARRPVLRAGAAVLGVGALAAGLLAAVPAQAAAPAAPLIGATAAEGSANGYVVVLKDAAGARAAGLRSKGGTADVDAAISRSRRLGATVQHRYSHLVRGYSARLTAEQLAAVRRDPAVEYVQANRVYRASGVTQQLKDGPNRWGLDRIDQRKLPRGKSYYYTATGAGVKAFVVDTGILKDHPDLKGRVTGGANFVQDSNGTNDCDGVDRSAGGNPNPDYDEGHGTHVAGVIGGTLYGVAKKVDLIPVRVLDCDGVGDTDTIIAGLDWIRANRGTGPAVANLSMATVGGTDPALGAAVKQLIGTGVTVVIAAGNGDETGRAVNACSVSPGDVRAAITVGASDTRDRRASFSNFGACVDVYAPGVDIVSDYVKRIDSKGEQYYGIESETGTSMATPHATGAVAMYLQRHPDASPATVAKAITGAASKNTVTGTGSGTRSLLFAVQPVVRPAGTTTGNRLAPGAALLRSAKLSSANDQFYLTVGRKDGRLSLKTSAGRTLWSVGSDVAWAGVTTSGALNAYDTYGRVTWSSRSTGGSASMYVNSGGYVSIVRDSDKKVLWRSR